MDEHYDEEGRYVELLMEKIEPRAQLTKTEYLMLVNHRPNRLEFLEPMIEDIDSRFGAEVQEYILETVAEVLGEPSAVDMVPEEEDGDANGETNGETNGDTSMADT